MRKSEYDDMLNRLEQSGANPRLLLSLRYAGPSEYAIAKLRYEISKRGLSADGEASTPETGGEEPTGQPPPAEKQPLHRPLGSIPVGLPADIEALEQEWRAKFRKAAYYLDALRDPRMDEEDRNQLVHKRMDLLDAVYETWAKLDHWKANGQLPEALRPPDPDTEKGLQLLDQAELLKLDERHRKYISKYKDDKNKAGEVERRKGIRAAIAKLLDA